MSRTDQLSPNGLLREVLCFLCYYCVFPIVFHSFRIIFLVFLDFRGFLVLLSLFRLFFDFRCVLVIVLDSDCLRIAQGLLNSCLLIA